MQIDAIAPVFDKSLYADSVQSAGAVLALPFGGPEATGTTRTFGQFLQDALAEVTHLQGKSADMTERFAAGEPIDVHQVMIAGQEASLAVDMTMQLRNKIVESYQEILRTNV